MRMDSTLEKVPSLLVPELNIYGVATTGKFVHSVRGSLQVLRTSHRRRKNVYGGTTYSICGMFSFASIISGTTSNKGSGGAPQRGYSQFGCAALLTSKSMGRSKLRPCFKRYAKCGK